MTKLFSLDTNILIYATDATAPQKMAIARRLLGEAIDTRAILSTQVLGELFRFMSNQKFGPYAAIDALKLCSELTPQLNIVAADADVFVTAMQLATQFKRQFWDCLIVATCAAHGVKTLYTEDLGGTPHKLLGVQLVNPFSNV